MSKVKMDFTTQENHIVNELKVVQELMDKTLQEIGDLYIDADNENVLIRTMRKQKAQFYHTLDNQKSDLRVKLINVRKSRDFAQN